MATLDKRRTNCYWLPADFRPNNTQRTVSYKHHPGSAPATANSRNQAAPLHKKAGHTLQDSVKTKSAVVTQRHEFPTYSKDDSVKAQRMCEAECFVAGLV